MNENMMFDYLSVVQDEYLDYSFFLSWHIGVLRQFIVGSSEKILYYPGV